MEKILFTSFKGGTGVTTCAIRLGLALAELGERVLYIDGDERCGGGLIAAGCANMQVYTLADFESGACRAKQAILSHPSSQNFCIMPSLGVKDRRIIGEAAGEVQGLFDFVLADKAPECGCTRAIIVTEPYLPSLKCADVCRAALNDGGISDVKLFVNKLNGGEVLSGEAPTAEEAAAILRLQLFAVAPEDLTLPSGGIKSATLKAFSFAAEALLGRKEGVCNVVKGYFGMQGYVRRKLRCRV